MKTLDALKISMAEKRLLQHLQLGGDVLDRVGKQLVVRFSQSVYSNPEIAAIAQRHGISVNDICLIYASMIEHLMPNPCINSGGLLLVPTLFFMEPFRFEGLASEIAARTKGLSEAERRDTLTALAVGSARQTWDVHTAGRGEAKFTITNAGGRKSAGCGGVGAIALFVALGLAYEIYKMLA